MNPSLTHIKNITGISRNHLAEIFGWSVNSVARWEVEPSTIPGDAAALWLQLQTDFELATAWIDETGYTWDQMIPARMAAMKLGISPHTLKSLLGRKRIQPIDFGLLGEFLTTDDLRQCKKP